MAVTSGFYNSKNHDRRYSNLQLSSIFDGIISDGVYASIGSCFIAKAGTGMTVTIPYGRCWFNHYWLLNDADYPVTIKNADVVLNRITAIVIEINSKETVRTGTIKAIDGAASSQNPQRPVMIKEDGVFQYPICYIRVNAGVTEIKQSDITNMVGTSECPFVTGVIATVNTDELVQQWQSEFEDLFDRMEEAIADLLGGILPDGSVSVELNGELGTSWSGDGPYTQRMSVIGMTVDDAPITDIVLSEDYELSLQEEDEYGYIRKFTTGEDYVDVSAKDKTTIPLNIKFKCIRK